MNTLEKELKKDNGIEQQLKTLTNEIQALRQENQALHKRLENIEKEISDVEVYNTSKDNYLSTCHEAEREEFERKVQADAKKGVDVSTISNIFSVKPRQAYNVKDRIVQEEDWIAEIPESNRKNRIVSKKQYLISKIKDEYPDLPKSIYDETGKSIGNHDWVLLFKAYEDNVMSAAVDQKVDKLEKIKEWFDVE